MDINKIIEGIQKLLEYMFGGNPPKWLLPTIAWGIALGLLLFSLNFIIKQLKNIWTELIQPAFYDPEDRRRRLRRQRFADHIESEIRRLNTQESWSDHRFTELEAEVEAEGNTLFFGLFSLSIFSQSRLRREKSLTKALERSSERLLLLEGEPGSGKSVALRHLTQQLSYRASRSNSIKKTIPIYINLKSLRRESNQAIDRSLIEEFIRKYLNRVNDRDIEEFLEDEFRMEIQQGTWLFLFDSFDEIPEVLSSTEADRIIREYAEAISDFLHGMNHCRGVVASREYKGPRFLGWPKFRILPMTYRRRNHLIGKTGLSHDAQLRLTRGILYTSDDFRVMTGNPMFLSLLCEFVGKNRKHEFPQHTYMVFEDYVWRRLRRDEERITRRYNKTPIELKDAAEKLAFCMTGDEGLGLSPTKAQLRKSANDFGFSLNSDFDTFVSALEYIKLARLESPSNGSDENDTTFSFSHRRFQEFFATSIVLKEPQRIPRQELLLNAKWRETAVVILQTKSPEEYDLLIRDAYSIIKSRCEELLKRAGSLKPTHREELNWFPVPELAFMFESNTQVELHVSKKVDEIIANFHNDRKARKRPTREIIRWPPKVLHILGILQDGLRGTQNILPDDIQDNIDKLLQYTMIRGSLIDEKWTLDIAGVASEEIKSLIITIGFISPSNWVKNKAFEQVGMLSKLSAFFTRSILKTLKQMSFQGELFSQRHNTYIHIQRLPDHIKLLYSAFLFAWLSFIDYICIIVASYLLLSLSGTAVSVFPVFILFSLMLTAVKWNIVSVLPLSIGEILFYAFSLLWIVVYESFLFHLSFSDLPQRLLLYSIGSWSLLALIVNQDQGKFANILWWPFYVLVLLIQILFGIVRFLASETRRLVLNIFFFLLHPTPYVKHLIRLLNAYLTFFKRGDMDVRISAKDILFASAWIIFIVAVELLLPILKIVLITLGLIGTIIGLIFCVDYSLQLKKTTQKINEKQFIEFKDFLIILNKCKYNFLRSRIIKQIREKSLIKKSESNIQMVTKLIAYLDYAIRTETKDLIPLKELDEIFYRLVVEAYPSIWRLNIGCLDELCKLHEQIAK